MKNENWIGLKLRKMSKHYELHLFYFQVKNTILWLLIVISLMLPNIKRFSVLLFFFCFQGNQMTKIVQETHLIQRAILYTHFD